MTTNHPTEHTLLVALTVEATTRADAERALSTHMPRIDAAAPITSWWIAEDDRHDGSDCDSAVFVTPGLQSEASALLHAHGLTPAHNLTQREVSPDFTDAGPAWTDEQASHNPATLTLTGPQAGALRWALAEALEYIDEGVATDAYLDPQRADRDRGLAAQVYALLTTDDQVKG